MPSPEALPDTLPSVAPSTVKKESAPPPTFTTGSGGGAGIGSVGALKAMSPELYKATLNVLWFSAYSSSNRSIKNIKEFNRENKQHNH
jgi:hypothetical protein